MFHKKNQIARWLTPEKTNKSADLHLEQMNKSAMQKVKSYAEE